MSELKHQGWVSDARFIPWVSGPKTGPGLLTADLTGTIRLWDLERGEVDREIVVEGEAHAYAVRRVAAAMSPDRRCLAVAATSESRVRIYDLEADRFLHSLQVSKPVHDLAFTSGGSLLVGTYNGGLQMFGSTQPDATPKPIGSKTAKVLDLHVSPAGVICLRYGYRLWRSFDLAGELPEQAHRQFDSASVSDAAVVFADQKAVHIRRRRRHRKRVRVRDLRSVAIAGRQIFAASAEGLLTLDLEGEPIEEASSGFGDSTSLAVSPDGRFVVHWVAYEPHRHGTNTVSVIDRGEVTQLQSPSSSLSESAGWDLPSAATPVVVEPESTEVASTTVGQHQVAIYRAGRIQVAGGATVELGSELRRAALMPTPQGRLLAHIDGTLELREMPTLKLLQRVRVNSRRTRIAHHGRYAAILEPHGFRLIDPRDIGRVVGSVSVTDTTDSPMVDFAITREDRLLYVRRNGEVGLVELAGVISAGAHVAPRVHATVVLRLPREVSLIEFAQDEKRARVAIGYRDGSSQTCTVSLPAVRRPAPDVGAIVSAPLGVSLTTRVREEIARLGGREGDISAAPVEAAYPDGVFPLPSAVRELFSVDWSHTGAFRSINANAWNGIVSSAPTFEGLDFSVRGIAPLMGRVRPRTLQKIRLICIARSDEGLVTVDMGSNPSDPVVYLVDERTGERSRLLPLSEFFARLSSRVEEAGGSSGLLPMEHRLPKTG